MDGTTLCQDEHLIKECLYSYIHLLLILASFQLPFCLYMLEVTPGLHVYGT